MSRMRDGQFQWSLHGEGSVEFCWALVVEAAAALGLKRDLEDRRVALE